MNPNRNHIEEELVKKWESEAKWNLIQFDGEKIRRKASEQAKEMNLNQVCLCFQALARDERGFWMRICDPVFSNTINNVKSALVGELKICRMSTFTSSCTGGQEVFLFVEKVCKSM